MNAPRPHSASPAENDAPVVLIVDPDRMSSLVIARAIEKAGYVAECVSTAAGALEVLAQRRAVLVICEATLPDLPAAVFVERSQAYYAPTPLPILVVTIDLRAPQRLALLRAGASDCLTKPIDLEELELRIARALTRPEPAVAPADVHLSGSLEHFALPDVLTVLDLARHSGRIEVAGQHDYGAIDVVAGRPVHAWYGKYVGMEALMAIFRLARGWFRVRTGTPPPRETLSGTATHLILEASVEAANRRRTPSMRRNRLEEIGVSRITLASGDQVDPKRLAARLRTQLADPLRLGELDVTPTASPAGRGSSPAASTEHCLTIALFGAVAELVLALWEVSTPVSPDTFIRARSAGADLRWRFQGRGRDQLEVRLIGHDEPSTSWFHLRADAVICAPPPLGIRQVDPAIRAYALSNNVPTLVLSDAEDVASLFAPAPFTQVEVMGRRLGELHGHVRDVLAMALELVGRS